MKIEASLFANLLKNATACAETLGYDAKNITVTQWKESNDGRLEIYLLDTASNRELRFTLPTA